MKKILIKIRIEGEFFNLIMNIYRKHTANIMLNGEGLTASPLRSGMMQGLSLLLFNSSAVSYSQGNKTRKGNERKK